MAHIFIDNLINPPVLFFFLGILGVMVHSDIEIPQQSAKFLSIYLLFCIGIKGGQGLYHSGFSFLVIKVVISCLLLSFITPFLVYKILRAKLSVYDAGAVAATYGSISAVTFATSASFLDALHVSYGGYMTAGMALMESPAIIAGLLLIGLSMRRKTLAGNVQVKEQRSIKEILHESCFNGSVFVLIGSLIVGIVSMDIGEKALKPFVTDVFQGMLTLYMLDMGLLAGRRMSDLRESGLFLIMFAFLYPLAGATFAIAVARLIGLDVGDAVLLTVLGASASYIAVPAAMRMSAPEANMSLLLPMALGITFTFNVTAGIPLYYSIIKYLWS